MFQGADAFCVCVDGDCKIQYQCGHLPVNLNMGLFRFYILYLKASNNFIIRKYHNDALTYISWSLANYLSSFNLLTKDCLRFLLTQSTESGQNEQKMHVVLSVYPQKIPNERRIRQSAISRVSLYKLAVVLWYPGLSVLHLVCQKHFYSALLAWLMSWV